MSFWKRKKNPEEKKYIVINYSYVDPSRAVWAKDGTPVYGGYGNGGHRDSSESAFQQNPGRTYASHGHDHKELNPFAHFDQYFADLHRQFYELMGQEPVEEPPLEDLADDNPFGIPGLGDGFMSVEDTLREVRYYRERGLLRYFDMRIERG